MQMMNSFTFVLLSALLVATVQAKAAAEPKAEPKAAAAAKPKADPDYLPYGGGAGIAPIGLGHPVLESSHGPEYGVKVAKVAYHKPCPKETYYETAYVTKYNEVGTEFEF